MTMTSPVPDPHTDRRKRRMELLARAELNDLRSAWNTLPRQPEYKLLRKPETGLVMVRGRIGGGGSPFNLGEATVTRATATLADGTVGHAWRLGTDRAAAELSAVIDALCDQDADALQQIETDLLRPLIYLRDSDTFTIPRGLKSLLDQFGFGGEWHWEVIVTASVITTVPMIILFFIGQKQFVDGIATTGSKG